MSYDDFMENYLKYERGLLPHDWNKEKKSQYINGLKNAFYSCVNSINDAELGGVELHAIIPEIKGLYLKCSNYGCYYDEERKYLNVLTIMPQFDEIIKAQTISNKFRCGIEWVFWGLINYVTQAHLLNIVLALYLVKKENIHTSQLFSGGTIKPDKFIIDKWNNLKLKLVDSVLNSEVESKLKNINCLDPDVNRVVYYYLQFKSYENTAEGFLSGILYMHNMVYSMMIFLDNEKGKPSNKNKKQKFETLLSKLKISDNAFKEDLFRLENIRNFFVAHPARVDWWYFGDRYHDFFERIRNNINVLLLNFLQYESNNRKVESEICLWGDWVQNNLSYVFTRFFFDVDENINEINNERFNARVKDVLSKSWLGLAEVANMELVKDLSGELFYNFKLNCFIVVKAKVSLTKKDFEDLHDSISYVNSHIKSARDRETVGVLISESNSTVNVQYISASLKDSTEELGNQRTNSFNDLFKSLPLTEEIQEYFE